MNLKSIQNELRQYFEKLKLLFKDIQGFPDSGKYLALTAILIIIFTILTFPYDYLIKKKLYDNESKLYKSISMQKFDFSIFGESYIDNLDMVFNNSNEISCKNIIINPSINPYRLFISKRIIADFQFDAIKYLSEDFEVILNINGNIDIVLNKLNSIPYNGELKLILGDARIKMNEVSIPGPMGPLPLRLDFVNIQNGLVEANIINGLAKIKNFKLTGTDLNCTVTGTMELSERFVNTKLDLSISVDPESQILEQYKELITAITKNGPLLLTVKGNLGRPEIKIAGTEKAQ